MSGIERFYSPPEIGAPGRREGVRRRRDLIIAGVFTSAMLLVVIVAIVFLFGFTGEKVDFRTECPASGGILPGTPVVQADYRIGQVVSVQPQRANGKISPPFTLQMRINRDWRVSSGDRFVIGSAGLLQGNVVKLVRRSTDSHPQVGVDSEESSQLDCEIEPNLLATVDPILMSIKRQVEALESLLLTDSSQTGDSRESIAGILENLREISDNLKKQMAAIHPDEVGDIVGSARTTARNVERITTALMKRSGEIDAAVEDFGALAERLNRLVEKSDPKIERSLSDTQYLLQELATALTPILNNLDETSQNLKELSQDLRKNPATALWGRDNRDNAPANRP